MPARFGYRGTEGRSGCPRRCARKDHWDIPRRRCCPSTLAPWQSYSSTRPSPGPSPGPSLGPSPGKAIQGCRGPEALVHSPYLPKKWTLLYDSKGGIIDEALLINQLVDAMLQALEPHLPKTRPNAGECQSSST